VIYSFYTGTLGKPVKNILALFLRHSHILPHRVRGGVNRFGTNLFIFIHSSSALQTDVQTDRRTDRRKSDLNSKAYYVTLAKSQLGLSIVNIITNKSSKPKWL